MWVSDWRLPTLREEMEEVLGPLAMFEVASATAAEALPLSEPAAIAALSGADKLVMRARLQVGHHSLLLGAAAPEVQHPAATQRRMAAPVGGGENPRINGAESVPESRSSSHRAALGSGGPAVTGNQPSLLMVKDGCPATLCKRWPTAPAFGGCRR